MEMTTLTQTYSAKKFFNVKDVKDNLTRLGAATSTGPSEQAVYTIVIGSVDKAALAITYDLVIEIEYIILFSEPKQLAQS